MARRPDAPSLGMVATGGFGVLVVLAFVAGVIVGRDAEPQPGDRVAVAAHHEPGLVTVFVARCPDERVRAVEVRLPEGAPLWRIESERGTIDRSFVVGAEPPPFFATVVDREGPLPSGELEVEVQVDDVVDRRRFEVDRLRAGEGVGVSCDEGGVGTVGALFVVGAAGVVVAYGVMVRRFLAARRP